MAMWMQKIVLAVVAVVPVIAGEIVRHMDNGGCGAFMPPATRSTVYSESSSPDSPRATTGAFSARYRLTLY